MRKGPKDREQVYINGVCLINLLFSASGFFICVCEFELPSNEISLLQCSFVLLLSNI